MSVANRIDRANDAVRLGLTTSCELKLSCLQATGYVVKAPQ